MGDSVGTRVGRRVGAADGLLVGSLPVVVGEPTGREIARGDPVGLPTGGAVGTGCKDPLAISGGVSGSTSENVWGAKVGDVTF